MKFVHFRGRKKVARARKTVSDLIESRKPKKFRIRLS